VKEVVPTPTAAPTPEPTAQPIPTATPRPAACTPGEPARLEVRPARKLMRPGESFSFRAVLADAAGCPTGGSTTWTLAPEAQGQGLTLAGGKVTIAEGALDGQAELTATAAGKSVKVTVEIASAARYDDLLGKQGLNAAGESEGAATAMIAGGGIGGADAHGEDGARRRKSIFIAIVATLAAVLGVLAWVYSRRSKRADALEREQDERHADKVREVEERRRTREEAHAAQVRAHEESVAEAQKAARATTGTMTCPTCRREFPPPTGNFCPADATRLVAYVESPGVSLAPAGSVCPSCQRGYPAGTRTCPRDGEELMPVAAAPAPPAGLGAAKGKICPTCGDRFDGGAAFCGKDGTALVLLN
jgi:hypothetical protein